MVADPHEDAMRSWLVDALSLGPRVAGSAGETRLLDQIESDWQV